MSRDIAIRQVTKHAVERGWIETDPMTKVRRPGGSRQARVGPEDSVRYWTAEELRRVLAAAREVLPPEHALIFEVLAGTGCRIAECLGLQFRDHRNGRLTIARSWPKARTVEPVKSASSRRTIEISPALGEAIDALRKARGAKLDEFVFATRTGQPVDLPRDPSFGGHRIPWPR
jgi:integrase